MPELPEVEVVCRGIEPHLVRQHITSVIIRNPCLRWPIPNNLKNGALPLADPLCGGENRLVYFPLDARTPPNKNRLCADGYLSPQG